MFRNSIPQLFLEFFFELKTFFFFKFFPKFYTYFTHIFDTKIFQKFVEN